jgi:transposase
MHMRAYSWDLRERIVAAVDAGTPVSVVARTFVVGPATVRRYLLRRQQQGTLAPSPIPGRPRRIGRGDEAALRAQARAHPDATLAEQCQQWQQEQGRQVSIWVMYHALARLGWTRKKNGCRQPSKTQ